MFSQTQAVGNAGDGVPYDMDLCALFNLSENPSFALGFSDNLQKSKQNGKDIVDSSTFTWYITQDKTKRRPTL